MPPVRCRVGENWPAVLRSLGERPGKDIGLFGSRVLSRSLAEVGLEQQRIYDRTGTVSLVYAVNSSVYRQ